MIKYLKMIQYCKQRGAQAYLLRILVVDVCSCAGTEPIAKYILQCKSRRMKAHEVNDLAVN